MLVPYFYSDMKKNIPFALCAIFYSFFLNSVAAQVPVIASFSPQSGPIGTLIKIKGSQFGASPNFNIGDVSAIVVSFSDTLLVGMIMPGTQTGLIGVETSNGSTKSENTFTITSVKPPVLQQGSKLIGSGMAGPAQQGISVAISADGNTAIVGGSADSDSLGAAWIFTRINGTWTQQGAKLYGTGAVGKAQQGSSVAISADGNTAVVGGLGDNNYAGAMWVFTRSNGLWTQQGNKLTGNGNTGQAQQGKSVAVSADGNIVVSGGWVDNTNQGAAWIFTRHTNTWTQASDKLVGSGAVLGANQGWSVSISADGETIAVGGSEDNIGKGATWIFKNNGTEWDQQGSKLVGTGSEGALGAAQGSSVSLSADGNTLLVGGHGDNIAKGAAWVFTRSGNTWTQQGNKLIGSNLIGQSVAGVSVALNADGNIAVIGGPGDDNFVGASWIFVRNESVWKQVGEKFVGAGGIDQASQGISCAISADGSTALVGGYSDNNFDGAVWVVTDSAKSLPVTLLNFRAEIVGKGVQTSWTGLNEVNMSGYNVERSVNGRNFYEAFETHAFSNTNQQNEYSWFDPTIVSNLQYYRIKAISKNGSFQYSGIIKITFGGTQPTILIYPNPVENKIINVQLDNFKQGRYQVAVYNIVGKKIYSSTYLYNGGQNSLRITANNFAKGIYVIEFNNKEALYKKSLIIP